MRDDTVIGSHNSHFCKFNGLILKEITAQLSVALLSAKLIRERLCHSKTVLKTVSPLGDSLGDGTTTGHVSRMHVALQRHRQPCSAVSSAPTRSPLSSLRPTHPGCAVILRLPCLRSQTLPADADSESQYCAIRPRPHN